jgi:hypothetical protein
MASSKAEDALRKQKDARQKKILIGLAPLLLLLLVWQGPGMLKAFTGGDKAPPPVVQPEGTPPPEGSTDPTAAPPPSTAAPAGTTITTGTPTVEPGSAELPESDEQIEAGTSQLVAFDRFVGKDPFKQLVEDKTDDGSAGAPAPTGDKPPASGGSGGGGGSTGGGGGGGDDDSGAPGTARLVVNGVAEDVATSGTFPESDPIFRLVSVAGSSVKIGLVSGQFSKGETVTVKVGKSVTLVSQPDGLRYVIKLVSVY